MALTKIGNIYVNAVVRIQNDEGVKVTKHPMTNGEMAAGCLVDEDNPLVLDVVCSDDRLKPLTAGSTKLKTADDKRDEIRKMLGNGLVNIQVPRPRLNLKNMMLTHISWEATARRAKTYEATLTFELIKTVSAKFIEVPLDRIKKLPPEKSIPAQEQQPTVDAGKQPATDPPESTKEVARSLLKSLADIASGQ